MPSWDSYKAEAQARGSFAHELYAVISTPAAAPEVVKQHLPAHLDYQSTLERQGALAFAGPLSDETGMQMQGMGLVIYRAATFEDARALAEADPMHAAGARTYTLRRWLVNEGSLTLSVGLSTKKIAL